MQLDSLTIIAAICAREKFLVLGTRIIFLVLAAEAAQWLATTP